MAVILRTPDERFADLPDFPYQPHYVDIGGLRMAYIDEGPADAEHTFLCLHGEPTWSFLYRKMIPVFTASGARVVAPDFFGFGRSDKPADDAAYTFDFHRDSLIEFIGRLDLQRITLVVQDWGGLLGLTLPVEPSITPRITRLLLMNTGLAVGRSPGPGFDAWRAYAASTDDLAVGRLIARSEPRLTDAEARAYDAPFPDKTFKAGVRRFPQLVMTEPDMPGVPVSREAAEFWSARWNGPTFMAVGHRDPVLGPAVMQSLAALINGCPPPLMLLDAGHFTQEHGDTIAAAALEYFHTH
ncbi:alpha/beta fold hydrolase [Nocardia sp. ET3-3]|uniref:Alpha/beta fold hydrolase n=1 Tax=Nocardia terrae TaxID=2675851 RepID=A0A7K1US70_9NOCA|nr:haloalkane dehalogenase [Nocardia terrae]MVU77175.1 alpha/beta fold hydrolase [Nocardia terrae]